MLYTKAFPQDAMFASASLHTSGDGYYIDVWFSVMIGFEPHVILNAKVPVYGRDTNEVGGAVKNAVDQLATLAPSIWGGTASPDAKGADRRHAFVHLRHHGKILDEAEGLSGTGDVAAMYILLGEFGVKNPAAMIADFCGMDSVRPIHELIADAREEGLIPRYGKGKSRP